MPGIALDVDRRRVSVGRWTRRATWVHGRSALVGLRRKVNLLVTVLPAADEVEVELWAGEPEVSDGLAVVVEGFDLAGIARIPLCGCGERGCGNHGRQLATTIPAADLPALVDVLAATPDLPGLPRAAATWRGELAGGRPVVH